jgi:NADH:flavin oxidoreductase / NADH oxidase family
MAPMTRSRATAQGVPTELNAEYYAQRASMALIISEGTQPSDDGQGYLFTPGMYTDDQVIGWRKVTEAVRRAGGQMFIQLMHVGRISHPANTPHGRQAVAPSAVKTRSHFHSDNRTISRLQTAHSRCRQRQNRNRAVGLSEPLRCPLCRQHIQNPLITAFAPITTIRLAMKVLESQRLIPPSISNSAPTVNAASSEARNTTAFAISLGCPNLPAGICLMNAACSSFDLPE